MSILAAWVIRRSGIPGYIRSDYIHMHVITSAYKRAYIYYYSEYNSVSILSLYRSFRFNQDHA